MGADYYAYTYMGIPVSEADFIEKVTTEKTVGGSCGHPEVEGSNFCPVCGAKGKHVVTETRRVWKANIRPHLPEEISEQDEADINDFLEYEDKILGFGLYRLDKSSMDADGQLIYGFQLHRVSGSSGWGADVNPAFIEARALSLFTENLTAAAIKLGLNVPIRLYTLCYCSV